MRRTRRFIFRALTTTPMGLRPFILQPNSHPSTSSPAGTSTRPRPKDLLAHFKPQQAIASLTIGDSCHIAGTVNNIIKPDVHLFGLVNEQIIKVQRRAAQAQVKGDPDRMGQQGAGHPMGQMPSVAGAHPG